MRSLKDVEACEDWAHLHDLAEAEFARAARRGRLALDDRSRILVELWLPHFRAAEPQLVTVHRSAHTSAGALIDDLRDLAPAFPTMRLAQLRHTATLFCSALVALFRSHPDHAPESLFGCLRGLVASAADETSPRVLGHIAAVVRGDGRCKVLTVTPEV